MFSSRNSNTDLIPAIYGSPRNVFRLKDISMITGLQDFTSLNKKLNYLVKAGKLLNPRKGIYAKPGYSLQELACNIYTPSYISLGTVLQEKGIIFQYSESISMISYVSRSIQIEEQSISFRKIKGSILANPAGIQILPEHMSKANAERAFLDTLYLQGDTWFDNLNSLNRDLIESLLPIYESATLEKRVVKHLENA